MPASRYISRLRISAFRNYQTGALDLDARHVVLVGPNGAGKTNLLEAVSLLAPGRGLRRATFDELGSIGSEGRWAVAATIETPDGPADIGTGAGEADGPRRVRINGANARAVEAMSAYLRLLWLTPAMDGLFTGPAADRRRFLDRLVTTLIPTHSAAVADYERAMRQRNRLLEENADLRWLDALETEMAALAAAVHFARADAVGRLRQIISEIGSDLDFPAAKLALTTEVGDESQPASSANFEAGLVDAWHRSRAQDRAAGRTLRGPHRVDLEVTHAQKQVPASLASTGEQKALLVGLILAHAQLVKSATGIAPFLLLDEIAAHFDPSRRRALFTALDALETQSLMTGTDFSLFDALEDRATRISVRAGRLSEWYESVPSETYELFHEAMSKRQPITCTYDGLRRELCPIILGRTDGEERVLAFQFAGETHNGPVRPSGEWKCLRLASVQNAELGTGKWHAGEQHSTTQTCIKEVDYDVNPDSPYHPRYRF